MSFSKLHYLNVGPEGTFKKSGNEQSFPADVDALFEHLKSSGQQKLTLYFHGGLVGEKSGMKTAELMYNRFSAQQAGHVYSIVWETGLLETLRERIEQVGGTSLFKELKDWVLKKVEDRIKGVFEGRGGEAIVSESQLGSTEDEICAELEAELEADPTLHDVLVTEAPVDPFYDKEKLPEDAPDGRGGFTMVTMARLLAKVAVRVIRRYIKKRNHDLYPTIVEEVFREFYVSELGTVVWDGIKDRVRKGMWLANTPARTGVEQYAGDYFLKGLNKFMGETEGFTLELVGHSAGSIAICHMLRAIETNAYTHIKARNIFLMAPAVRSKLFLDEVINKKDRWEAVKMYTMTDDAERNDNMVPAVYTSSLLYLVSGILEHSNDAGASEGDTHEAEGDFFVLGMARFMEQRAPFIDSDTLNAVRDFFSQPGRLYYSPSAAGSPAGTITTALKHGKFDDADEPTMDSIIYWIKQ